MRWAAFRISIDGSEEAMEASSHILLESGSGGVLHEVGAHDEVTAITGYFPEDDRLESTQRKIGTALFLLPAIGITGVSADFRLSFVEEEDWATSWKKYFKPIRVGRHIVISPPWETPETANNDKLIVIDPGMAFGTGYHPTTQLCLTALEDYIDPQSNAKVADIGTGSGILAIAAAKLGAGTVFATDTDPLAIRIARENALVNNVVIDIGAIPEHTIQFDILVANILANTLIDLAERMASQVKPDGIYIASGIIEGRENDVRLYTEAEGFQPLETRQQGEWLALVFRRLEDIA